MSDPPFSHSSSLPTGFNIAKAVSPPLQRIYTSPPPSTINQNIFTNTNPPPQNIFPTSLTSSSSNIFSSTQQSTSNIFTTPPVSPNIFPNPSLASSSSSSGSSGIFSNTNPSSQNIFPTSLTSSSSNIFSSTQQSTQNIFSANTTQQPPIFTHTQTTSSISPRSSSPNFPQAVSSNLTTSLIASSNIPSFNISNEPKGPPQACIFVASISEDTSEESIRRHFGQFGVVLKAKIQKDRASRPYAFVQFQEIQAAEEALRSTKLLDGRKIRTEKAKVNRTLFVAKLNKISTAQELREAMSPYGPVESVTIIKNHETQRSKGCAFVKFQYREDALAAYMALKSNRKWVVEWATSNNDAETLGLDKFSVFIGGLNPLEVTRELLYQKFSPFGEIESLSLINKDSPAFVENVEHLDTPSLPKSAFAFIRYTDPGSSIAAIENLNGVEWMDRRLRVQYCESAEIKNKRKLAKGLIPSQTTTTTTTPSLPQDIPGSSSLVSQQQTFSTPIGSPISQFTLSSSPSSPSSSTTPPRSIPRRSSGKGFSGASLFQTTIPLSSSVPPSSTPYQATPIGRGSRESSFSSQFSSTHLPLSSQQHLASNTQHLQPTTTQHIQPSSRIRDSFSGATTTPSSTHIFPTQLPSVYPYRTQNTPQYSVHPWNTQTTPSSHPSSSSSSQHHLHQVPPRGSTQGLHDYDESLSSRMSSWSLK